MTEKKVLYTELSYILGIVILALGTALMERADFGMSMVVAPAYLVYLKISTILPWYTFGMAEYCLQAFLLLITALIWRRFKMMYLFSFVTAVIYGVVLDTMIFLLAKIPQVSSMEWIPYYLLGMILCSLGVSFLFHTYFAPEAYELLVKEISVKYGTDIHKTKTAYDCSSCLIAILLSFIFFGFGHFEGVKLGTVICALVNGSIIGLWTKLLEKKYEFKDRFK